ncbi:hypothetical protein L3V79_00650 [Thiotrichales bacterium 19S9-12]|nr:hypothetical protein [Thiotrichales bacterium 19S9-11]MCF6810870.1 hypothetical protein [Thiotrichales bacterium 19S9-12]
MKQTKQKVIIYAETSINKKTIHSIIPNALIKPSIKAGDLIQAINHQYNVAIIIDGNFNFTRSIWHKEILWAMTQGVKVIGCSSMGALRAAELDQFGMIGSGYVYSLYKNNITSDDSEVAVNYSITSKGIQSSIPFVNIRYTLEHLLNKHFINKTEQNNITKLTKNIFYKKRTWAEIKVALPEKLYHLLKDHYIDIKYIDALHCLHNYKLYANFTLESKLTNFSKTLFLKKLIAEQKNIHEFETIKEKLETQKIYINHTLLPNNNRLIEFQKLTGFDHKLSINALNLSLNATVTLTEEGLKQNLKQFRIKYQLVKGEIFKRWCCNKKLNFDLLEQTFSDYFTLKRLLN